MRKLLSIVFAITLLASCSKNIEEINYGSDQCEFCSMTIVDKTHAAQVVTNKGRNYKFDATECLIHYLEEQSSEDNMLHVLSANFLNPGEMLDVNTSAFIISDNIPSPMGAFLSVVENTSLANEVVEENGGDIYTWSEIKDVLKLSKSRHGH